MLRTLPVLVPRSGTSLYVAEIGIVPPDSQAEQEAHTENLAESGPTLAPISRDSGQDRRPWAEERGPASGLRI
jgi:hypothetical protein